jgi:hypothetical protein
LEGTAVERERQHVRIDTEDGSNGQDSYSGFRIQDMNH